MLYTILLVLMLNAIFKEVESKCSTGIGLDGCWIDGECRTRLEIDSLLEAAKLPKTNGLLTNETCDQIRTSLNMTKDSPSGTTESKAASSTSTPTESEAASSTSTPTDCKHQHRFLNYIIADNSLYCVINRPKDRNLNGQCIKASKLWDKFTGMSTTDRWSRWDVNHQWLSHFMYKMIGDPKMNANIIGQLHTANLESEIAVLAPGLSVNELEDSGDIVKIRRNSAGVFLGPYSICEILLIDSIYNLVDKTATETCPIVDAACTNYSPVKSNGIFYNVKYEDGSATGCYIRRKSADKKCLSIDKVVGILQNYGEIGNHNEEKRQYSQYRRIISYDEQKIGFHEMAKSSASKALETYNKILGLKENEERTIKLNGVSVNVGDVTLCTIASMHIPLGDNYRDFIDC